MSINLTTLVQVMPYAQNVAHAELVHPQVQQAVAAQAAQESLRHENEQVQKTEKQDGPATVKEDGRRNGGGASGRRRQKRPEPEPQAEDDAGQGASFTPFAGHIINMKI